MVFLRSKRTITKTGRGSGRLWGRKAGVSAARVWKTKEVKNSADYGLSAQDVSGGKNIKHVA